MKIAIVVVAFMAIAAVSAEEAYTTKFDNIDVDEILKSSRLFDNYYNCLIDAGNCTPEARELKKILPDALKTECSKCNEKQRKNAEKVIRNLIDEKPDQWKVLQAKYDPDNIYTKKYKSEAAARGIKI